ncbi:MAG: dihydropyrimidinase [Mesorhizobium sp.]
MHDLVVRGGRVALDGGWAECDIGITDGRIAELGTGVRADTAIDAGGRWVLPGGIDAHCHLDQPSWGGAASADDFESGSIAAAFGGTTCMVPFAMPGPGMTSIDAFDRAIRCAAGRSMIDYGLHGVVTAETGADLAHQFDVLARQGVTSIKVFMTYEGFAVGDETLLAVLDEARTLGFLVMVHAENDAAIRRTRNRLIELGRTDLRYHAVAHARVMEREATHRAVALAEISGTRLVVVHVSCRQSAEEVLRGQQRGARVFAETCPQYLFLSAADLDRDAAQAARYVFSPPPRAPSDQAYLWEALTRGDIALWSSDHSPSMFADKLGDDGKPAFHKAVSGIPGIETRLPLLFCEGLLTGRLSLQRYLAVTGGNAASLYGLDHVKGRIALGLDADLAIWDPAVRWRLMREAMHSKVDYIPYEGRTITGKPVTTLVRGMPVVLDGILCPATGAGRFVPRKAGDPRDNPIAIEDTTPWLDT